MNRRMALGTLFAAPLAALAALRLKSKDDLYREWLAKFQRHPFSWDLVCRGQEMRNEIQHITVDEARWGGFLRYVSVESYGP